MTLGKYVKDTIKTSPILIQQLELVERQLRFILETSRRVLLLLFLFLLSTNGFYLGKKEISE
jgi:hypothetical protein